MKEKRFKRIYIQGSISTAEILVDTVTGVNYLFMTSGQAGGLTPLLDEKGQPVITPNALTDNAKKGANYYD